MTDDATIFGSEQSLPAALEGRRPLSVREALVLVATISSQVEQLHQESLLHRAISLEAIGFDEQHQAQLAPPGPPREFGGSQCHPDVCPPELQKSVTVLLPAEWNAARAAISKAGVRMDPARIDLYQLGALLCRLLTRESVPSYLRSPRVKAEVPAIVQPLIDHALGHDDSERFASVSQFVSAIRDRLREPSQGDSESGPGSSEAADQRDDRRASGAGEDTSPNAVTKDLKSDTSVAPDSPARTRLESEPPFDKLGHYEIVGRIGRGGMGDVYKGYERALDRVVAIKVLPSGLARQEDFVRRFHAEASAAAKLSHPNIIQIHFIGEDHGRHYFAMQYVEGESLAQLLARSGRLSVDETLSIVEQTLRGMAAAHKRGMVHRDIKPGNILIDRRNQRALITDFGLVKSVEASGGLTATGTVMGTVDYLSPEQARGRPTDARSDLYSLGVLMYEMLSGRLPFQADSPTAILFQHVYEQPPPLGDTAAGVPEPMAALVARLLAKSPDDRPQSAEQVLADLRAIRADEPLRPLAEPAPSGEGTAIPSELPRPAPRTQTAVIRAPTFDDSPSLPEGFGEAARTGWWSRTRDRAFGLVQAHAPELAAQLQNTQQQVAGAVALYESRRDELERLVVEAEAAFQDIESQAKAHRAAADRAQRRAAEAEGEEDVRQAVREQVECRQTAEELEGQLAEQEEQLQAIRLRLAQVNAQLRQLKSQRDLLKGRLKVAQARYVVETAKPSGRRRWIVLAAAVLAVVGSLAFGAVLVGRFLAPNRSTPPRTAETANLAPSPETPASSSGKKARPRRKGFSHSGDSIPIDKRVLSMAFSMNAHRSVFNMGFVTGNEAGDVDIYRIEGLSRGAEDGGPANVKVYRLRFSGHSGPVNQVAVSPDGAYIASAGEDKTIYIWPYEGDTWSKEAAVLTGHTRPVTAVAYGGDSRLLLSGSRDGTVRVWDWRLRKELARFDVGGPAGATVKSLAWSRDGQQFMVGLDQAAAGPSAEIAGLSIWGVDQKTRLQAFSASGPPAKIAYSFDRTTVLSRTGAAIQRWDVSRQEPAAHFAEDVVAADFDVHGSRVLTGHADHSVGLWDARTGTRLATFLGHQGEITSAVIRVDGRVGATASADGTIRVWDLSPREGELHVFRYWGDVVHDVAFSPDGFRAAYAAQSGEIGVMELEMAKPGSFFSGSFGNVAMPLSTVQFSPDGAFLLYATAQERSKGNRVGVRTVEKRMWYGYSASDLRAFDGKSDAITTAAFSHNGQNVATGNVDGVVRIWSVRNEREVASLNLGAPINRVAISPNGPQVLIASDDKTVLLWDWIKQQEVRRFSGHTSMVLAAAISADGRRAATGGADRTIRVWDFETGRLLKTLTGHADRVNAVAATDQGDFVLSGSDDATARYWDVASGKEIERYFGHSAPVRGVAISPDGARALSGGDDWSAQLWQLPTPSAGLPGRAE